MLLLLPLLLLLFRHLLMLLVIFCFSFFSRYQFTPGWLGQAFIFNKSRDLSFGLLQSKVGKLRLFPNFNEKPNLLKTYITNNVRNQEDDDGGFREVPVVCWLQCRLAFLRYLQFLFITVYWPLIGAPLWIQDIFHVPDTKSTIADLGKITNTPPCVL